MLWLTEFPFDVFLVHDIRQGLEARTNLLELHRIQPFLDPKEQKALDNFTGSDSWAKKFAKRNDLKMTGARIKELSEEDVKQYHQTLKEMAIRVKQAGPAFEEAANLMRQAGETLLKSQLATVSNHNKQSDANVRLHRSIARRLVVPNQPSPSTNGEIAPASLKELHHDQQHSHGARHPIFAGATTVYVETPNPVLALSPQREMESLGVMQGENI